MAVIEEKYLNKKYLLFHILDSKYSKLEAKKKKKEIIDKLFISERTLKNWIYMMHDHTTEISYINLKKLSAILDTPIDNLINFEINV